VKAVSRAFRNHAKLPALKFIHREGLVRDYFVGEHRSRDTKFKKKYLSIITCIAQVKLFTSLRLSFPM
jgi:hypothetical protein